MSTTEVHTNDSIQLPKDDHVPNQTFHANDSLEMRGSRSPTAGKRNDDTAKQQDGLNSSPQSEQKVEKASSQASKPVSTKSKDAKSPHHDASTSQTSLTEESKATTHVGSAGYLDPAMDAKNPNNNISNMLKANELTAQNEKNSNERPPSASPSRNSTANRVEKTSPHSTSKMASGSHSLRQKEGPIVTLEAENENLQAFQPQRESNKGSNHLLNQNLQQVEDLNQSMEYSRGVGETEDGAGSLSEQIVEEVPRNGETSEKAFGSNGSNSGVNSGSKRLAARERSWSAHEESVSEQNNKIQKVFNIDIKKKKVRQCFNRLCLTDPNNASLWSAKKVKNSSICKTCYDAYNKRQFCLYCYQIYYDQDGQMSNDDKEWVGCEKCDRWVHLDCEANNTDRDIRNLVKDDSFKFICRDCRSPKGGKVAAKRAGKALAQTENVLDAIAEMGAPYQKPTSYRRGQQVAPKARNHPKPLTNDKFLYDDGIEEYITKKTKQDEYGEFDDSSKENSQSNPYQFPSRLYQREQQQQNTVYLNNSESIKKKLDVMFSRNSYKRRTFPKPTTTSAFQDAYNDIDKLMTQYAGKKINLPDTEIKKDLALFRELSECVQFHSSDKSGDEEMKAVSYSNAVNSHHHHPNSTGLVNNNTNNDYVYDYGESEDKLSPEEDRHASRPARGRGGNRGTKKTRGGATARATHNKFQDDDVDSESTDFHSTTGGFASQTTGTRKPNGRNKRRQY